MEEKNINKDDIEKNKVVAAMSYLWILCLVPLFLKRNSAFAQFHAKQGLVLFIIEIVGWLVFWIPFLGQLLLIAIVLVAIIAIIKAYQGSYWKIPVIGDFAKKINL
jgi:fumarate reductase subunit D